jgi:hypothetical protein
MTTNIRCEFIGGPKHGETVDLPKEQCRESLAVNASGWIAVVGGRLRRFDPHEPIPEPKPRNWHSYVCSIYLRVHKLHPTVIYWYMRDQLIERCQAVVEGAQCMNAAMTGHVGCTKHPYGAAKQRRSGLSDRRRQPRGSYTEDRDNNRDP